MASSRFSFYQLSIEEVLSELGSSTSGLSFEDVAKRQVQYGKNRIPLLKRPSLLLIFFRQFQSPMIYVLLVAAAISLFTGDRNESIFIMAIIFINAILGAYHEKKAVFSMDSLYKMVRERTRVVRENRTIWVNTDDLIPGDIVLLESGQYVPADLRLISAHGLLINESLLTGESFAADKTTGAMNQDLIFPADQKNMAFAATLVEKGRGTGVVTGIGLETQIGRIAGSLSATDVEKPPLIKRMDAFSHRVSLIVIILCLLMALSGFIEGMAIREVFFLMVAAGVSAIPEGLPIALTVALATGARRMAKRKVIIRKLPAVEGLGSCTLIASDKTGTLTMDKPAVRIILLPDGYRIQVSGPGNEGVGYLNLGENPASLDEMESLFHFIRACELCNEASLHFTANGWTSSGDPVDVALRTLSHKSGKSPIDFITGTVLVRNKPYEPEDRYAAAFTERNGEEELIIKGAVEVICRYLSKSESEKVAFEADELSRQGFRVIAFAGGNVSHAEGTHAGKLKCLGMAGLLDPLRPEAKEAIKKCHKAGLQVVMITGDHPATALAIAKELGLATEWSQVITGSELECKGESDIDRLAHGISEKNVFARVTPLQKKDLVLAFKSLGHFVAVTGDGANDAPALKAAHIGVAMGSGAELARESASIVLTDDNFASIVAGVEEGRFTYDNLRNIIHLLLSTGLAELLTVILALIFLVPIPFLAVQLLWLNLVTNGIQEIGLAFEKGDPDAMRRLPRAPGEKIFDRLMVGELILSGITITVVVFITWEWEINRYGIDLTHARSVVMMLMVMMQNFHVLNCRSERRSLFRLPFRNNPILVMSIVLAQSIHISAAYIPGLRDLLHLQPMTFKEWTLLLPLAFIIFVVMEIFKWFVRKYDKQSGMNQV